MTLLLCKLNNSILAHLNWFKMKNYIACGVFGLYRANFLLFISSP